MIFQLEDQCLLSSPQDEPEDHGGGRRARILFIKDGTGLKRLRNTAVESV